MINVIYDVDIARDIKDFIVNNSDDVDFSSLDIKKKIFSVNDDDLVRIGKIIDSPTKIVSIDVVDAAFFRDNLYKKDGDQN
ncbi:MAG: hypothetical protein AABW75_03085 [Nanoarchaeota archaeon]